MMVAVDVSPCPYPQILRFNPAATTVRDIPAWANGPGLRCPPPQRAEGPVHPARARIPGSGLQPFAFPAPGTWAVGPGWYEHGPLALKRRLGLVGKDKR